MEQHILSAMGYSVIYFIAKFYPENAPVKEFWKWAIFGEVIANLLSHLNDWLALAILEVMSNLSSYMLTLDDNVDKHTSNLAELFNYWHSSITSHNGCRFCTLLLMVYRHNIGTTALSPNSITPTFTKTSPWGKSWTQIMKVSDTNGDKSWNHEVLVKVANTNHEIRGHKPSRHVEMFATKSATNPFVSL